MRKVKENLENCVRTTKKQPLTTCITDELPSSAFYFIFVHFLFQNNTCQQTGRKSFILVDKFGLENFPFENFGVNVIWFAKG